MTLYAAYGNNLDPDRMALRAPHSPLRGSGWLSGWRMTFAGELTEVEGPRCTIVECPEDPSQQVYVALYDLTSADERALDEWEGLDIGQWNKLRVRVATLQGDVTAWAYVLDAYEGGLPNADYLHRLGSAAEAGGAPSDYVQAILQRSCNPTFPEAQSSEAENRE